MLRKFMKLLMIVFCIALIVGSVKGLGSVARGGYITMGTKAGTATYDGAGGMLMALFWLCVGIGALRSLLDNGNRDNICSRPGLLEEYPYCRWWQNEEDWYSEHNPMMKVTYPENHICSVCKKKIEKYKYNETSEEKK